MVKFWISTNVISVTDEFPWDDAEFLSALCSAFEDGGLVEKDVIVGDTTSDSRVVRNPLGKGWISAATGPSVLGDSWSVFDEKNSSCETDGDLVDILSGGGLINFFIALGAVLLLGLGVARSTKPTT